MHNISPTHSLRPAVRGQTNRYNNKIRLGRGFTKKELEAAGVKGLSHARSLGIAVDLRRKDTSNETLKANSERLRTYLGKIILHPRRANKYAKKSEVPEAKTEILAGPEAKSQNTTKQVIRKFNFNISSAQTGSWILLDSSY